jgi:hypothetical protein
MIDNEIELKKKIDELEKVANEKYRWLTKNSNSPCFEDVARDYNNINQRIENLRAKLTNEPRKFTGEWTGSFPARQSQNCFTSIHN